MADPRIHEIVVDPAVLEIPLVQGLLARRGTIPYRVGVVDAETVPPSLRKRLLYVTQKPGGLVKPCPGTNPPYLCCRYQTIHVMTQCPFDCVYCVLQDYLGISPITLYANLERVFEEAVAVLQRQPHRLFRFGTGELADSLALDDLTGLSEQLLSFFSHRKNALIELKTKSDRVASLLTQPSQHVVVSWSLNPPAIITQEEHGTPGLEARLEAARRCMEAGFLVGFHFDPILDVPDWGSVYRRLIHQVFDAVKPTRIAWISLGSLRFPPALSVIMRRRFPRSSLIQAEMVRGLDGKMRYPRPWRVELYRSFYGWIREKAPEVFVYFCMESPVVWDAVMGFHPSSNAELDYRFAQSLWERFGGEIRMDPPDPEAYRDPCSSSPDFRDNADDF